MSLDFELISAEPITSVCECESCGNVHTKTEIEVYFRTNITHNLTDLADAAGLYKPLWNSDGKKASDITEQLRKGIAILLYMPVDKVRLLSPKNGYGSWNGLVRFAKNVLNACEQYPDAIIRLDK